MIIPKKEQLIETIQNGDDSKHNTLIIKLNGEFELLNKYDKSILTNHNIVTRFETFVAGNRYVGINASKDEELINMLYLGALDEWFIFLKTGIKNSYCDLESQFEFTIDELVEKITNGTLFL